MADRRDENRRLLVRLAVAAAVMFGFGFALVPFYEKICEATGINNLLQPDQAANTQVDPGRKVVVEFDANTHDPAADVADRGDLGGYQPDLGRVAEKTLLYRNDAE